MEPQPISPKDIEVLKVYFDLTCLVVMSAAVFIWINLKDIPNLSEQRRNRVSELEADLFEQSLKTLEQT